jgi:2-polyprenyl-3-methyl-5-hydroxy-6-metoxy-1,4-benzoquinol methylase
MAFGREDYERQGAQVLSSGSEFRCSSVSIVNAVIIMARNNCHRFNSILDVGCGAGGTIERMVNLGFLRRFSSSIAVVAQKAH